VFGKAKSVLSSNTTLKQSPLTWRFFTVICRKRQISPVTAYHRTDRSTSSHMEPNCVFNCSYGNGLCKRSPKNTPHRSCNLATGGVPSPTFRSCKLLLRLQLQQCDLILAVSRKQKSSRGGKVSMFLLSNLTAVHIATHINVIFHLARPNPETRS
jgi:hypothetical protein